MKKRLSVIIACLVFVSVLYVGGNTVHAIEEVDKIIPTPQEVTYTEQFLEIFNGSQFTAAIVMGKKAPSEEIEGANFVRHAIERLTGKHIPILNAGDDYSTYSNIISIGSTNSNALNKTLVSDHSISIPNHEEGYVIKKVNDNKRNYIVVAGKNNIGSYYGSLSLAQMFKKDEKRVILREITVRDWPSMDIRAVKDINNYEGMFSYDDAKDWMKFLSKTKINVFSLCYTHLTDQGWRNPTSDYVNAVKEMSNYERDKGTISFMQEINPGYTGGLPENEKELNQLVETFKLSLDEGASKIMLAFDDQGSREPSSHRQLANTIYNDLKGKEDFHMVTVPEPYHFGYPNFESYHKEYTDQLEPDIDVAWTGDELWSHYTTPEHVAKWTSSTSSPTRLPFYWHNDPMLDETRLFTDWEPTKYYFTDARVPFKGVDLSNDKYIWNSMGKFTSNGVIENIFRETTTHKIYAIALADWMWNPAAYENSTNTFKRAKRYWDNLLANPALTKKATASSQFNSSYDPELAVDGLTSSDTMENVWATAPNQPLEDAWWQVDLGMKQDITGLRIKYREFPSGKAYMVPESVTVQVSSDGLNWDTVVKRSGNVPSETSDYHSNPYVYAFDTSARFIKLLFEDGGQNDLIELSEVEVLTEIDRGEVPSLPENNSADIIKSLVNRFEEEGAFKEGNAAHSLKTHLTAVGQFENLQKAEKVVKHMNSFIMLLENQKENELISVEAYKIIKVYAEDLIQKWRQ